MDERGLKVYEYNADSASCHTEAGLILERWAERGYTGQGHNPAEGLINELAGARKHSRARPFVHIMQDKDIEENYHAQFMQQALRQAGFDSKILRGLDELRWDDAGQLIDGDGRPVNCVWKPGRGKPRLSRCERSAKRSTPRYQFVPGIRIRKCV